MMPYKTEKTPEVLALMSNKKREMTSGNMAFAEAMRQINPDVVAAYPITPSTEIPVRFAEFVANGNVTSE